MKVYNDRIELESLEDRQLIWDALFHYANYALEMSKSNHCAKDIFADTLENTEKVMTQCYENFEGIMH